MAISALGFLAADTERLERFLSISLLGPSNLQAAAADPGFYASILDYLIGDEPLLLAFAADAGLKPDEVVRALQSLSRAPPAGEPLLGKPTPLRRDRLKSAFRRSLASRPHSHGDEIGRPSLLF
jgi:hypothetical protein